jgi:hypothetical protein
MCAKSKIVPILIFTLFANLSAAGQNYFPATNGNHFIKGSLDLAHAEQIHLQFKSFPTWIVGYGQDDLSIWYILLDNSTIQKVTINQDGMADVSQVGFSLPSDSFLALDINNNRTQLFSFKEYRGNFLTHPIRTAENDAVAAISDLGNLIIQRQARIFKPDIEPLIDSRILQNNRGQILVLTGNSSRYQHGILGDKIEPTGYAVIDTHGEPYVKYQFSLNDRGVFETLMPIWTDIDNDKKDEVILTRSDAQSGARLMVYSEDGKLLAYGRTIGRGFRWMHLLAAAPFGPNGELEIAAVKTPHIGGILEFYRLVGRNLIVVNRKNGYSTHRIGTRNLDTALAGNFNSDINVEILIPTQDFRRINSIKRTALGSVIDFSVPLSQPLSTNIAAYTYQEEISLAIGTFSGEVIIIR